MHIYRKLLLGALVLVAVLLLAFSGTYLDWLWFKSMHSLNVFWTAMITGPVTTILIGLLILLFFVINIMIALKSFNKIRPLDSPWLSLPKEAVVLPAFGVSLVLAFFLASSLSLDWTTIQQYIHQIKVGAVDPFFGKDLGFYFFSYPLYQKISSLTQAALFIGLIGCAVIYFLSQSFTIQGRFWEIHLPAKIHLTILTILFFIAKIGGYYLNRFGLLYQESPRLSGINYTAAHANLLALSIMSWMVAGIIVLLIISLFRKNSLILLGSIGAWLILSVILGGLYPAFIQSFIVTPNEYQLEEPYLKNHIQMTRRAFGLDHIQIKPFHPQDTDNVQINATNPALADLRLWDYRPLQSSYNQLQSIRSYYNFHDIDIDRYPSTDGQHQVMLAAREIVPNDLSARAKSWFNLHLVYTHGYGFAANQANQFSEEGQPIFISRDLPPKTDPQFPALKIKRPEIYFGELTNDYCIVNTKTEEFDYPQGNRNISTTYRGKNGISLSSPFIKLLLALKYQESNFLLSNYLTSHSQILLYRNIQTRIRKLAPFLKFDKDPYLVVANKRLYWIVDGYTVSSYFPYARQHSEGLNYIRNSVKAVVNAYNGKVDFYIVDAKDPLIKVWQRVFPKFFKPVSKAPTDIVNHFRYSEDLLSIQRDMLAQYHMTDTKTFYLQEDYWDVPVYNNNQLFDPYYVTLLLPGETIDEFVLIQPFSPRSKQNLISWLVARSDRKHYGELVLYTLPKDKSIYGPAQIDNRINQNETISQLITLWNQNQSQVVWGNLLIIPIENSILYVKPLFIESEQGQQAELKKIVMVYKNQVILGETVAEAISNIAKPSTIAELQTEATPISEAKPNNNRSEILKQIQTHTQEIQRLLKKLNNM